MLQRLRYAHAARGPGQCNLYTDEKLQGRPTCPNPPSADFFEQLWCHCNTVQIFTQRHTAGRIAMVAYQCIPTNWGHVMTISSLLSSEQITAISVEITDADFNRTEVIGDLIRHTEIVDVACPEASLARTSLNETYAA
jgi:hypothetical protein